MSENDHPITAPGPAQAQEDRIAAIITHALLEGCDNHRTRAQIARQAARQVMEVRTAAFSPTHRHRKRGSLYRVIGNATAQVSHGHAFFNPETDDEWVEWPLRDGSRLTVYQGEDGKLWARFTDEFEDGRFEKLPATHPGQFSPSPSYEDGVKEGLRRAAEVAEKHATGRAGQMKCAKNNKSPKTARDFESMSMEAYMILNDILSLLPNEEGQ